jgi:hypothetical protein
MVDVETKLPRRRRGVDAEQAIPDDAARAVDRD